MSDHFEGAFSDFLDRHEYDEAENALFSMVRISFLAGWRAAGGAEPSARNEHQDMTSHDRAVF